MGSLWLLVALTTVLTMRLLPASKEGPDGELQDIYISLAGLTVIVLALLMSFQSFLVAVFKGTSKGTPNSRIERPREP